MFSLFADMISLNLGQPHIPFQTPDNHTPDHVQLGVEWKPCPAPTPRVGTVQTRGEWNEVRRSSGEEESTHSTIYLFIVG